MYFVPNFDKYLITETNEIMTKSYSVLKIWKNSEKKDFIALVNNNSYIEIFAVADFIAQKQPIETSNFYIYPRH